MKFKTGFVSNSSTTSFCIYGWSGKTLSEHIANFCPVFKDVYLEIDSDDFLKNIEKEYDGPEWDIACANDREGEQIFGVGNAAQYEDYDISKKPPTQEQKEKLQKVIEKFNLPKPEMFSDKFTSGY